MSRDFIKNGLESAPGGKDAGVYRFADAYGRTHHFFFAGL